MLFVLNVILKLLKVFMPAELCLKNHSVFDFKKKYKIVMHIVIFFSTSTHNYGKLFFFFYYRIKCNGIPIQQIRELSGRQLIGSGDHRHWQPMRFSLTTNNPEVVRVQKNRLIHRPFILRPGFSYFRRMFVKRQPYFVV